MLIDFEFIRIRRVKVGKCITCGKARKRIGRFEQTINPFNVNPDGSPKNRYQIMDELNVEADEWMREPINCCA